MNAVLQKPRAKTSSGASYGSDWASVHGRNFAIRPSHFALRPRRRRSFALRTSPFDLPRSGDADGASDVENPYTFTGRRLDLESGLMQYRYRYYDPGLGRFVGRDPLGYLDIMSLYHYVHAATKVDPMGLDEVLLEQTITINQETGDADASAQLIFVEEDILGKDEEVPLPGDVFGGPDGRVYVKVGEEDPRTVEQAAKRGLAKVKAEDPAKIPSEWVDGMAKDYDYFGADNPNGPADEPYCKWGGRKSWPDPFRYNGDPLYRARINELGDDLMSAVSKHHIIGIATGPLAGLGVVGEGIKIVVNVGDQVVDGAKDFSSTESTLLPTPPETTGDIIDFLDGLGYDHITVGCDPKTTIISCQQELEDVHRF